MEIGAIEAEVEARKASMDTPSICEVWKSPNMTDIAEVSAEIEGEVSASNGSMTLEACTVTAATTVVQSAASTAEPEVAAVTTS